MSSEAMNLSSLQLPSDNTSASPSIHQQIKSKELDEIINVILQTLAIKSVQNCMTRPICYCTSSKCLTSFAEVQRLASECSLINLAVCRTAERTTFKLKIYYVYY